MRLYYAFTVLLAAQTRAGPEQVSVAVRNLAGRPVMVSWLQPGREPRARVPQEKKPLKNASVMSIDSFLGHEFIVAEARRDEGKQDMHESCAFWASVDECAKNPSYMLKSCARACARAASNSTDEPDELAVVFQVADSPETVTVVDANGTWAVERSGPAHDAASALEQALDECGLHPAAETCSELSPCVGAKLEAVLEAKVAALALERGIYEASRAEFPVASPDHEAKAPPTREDLAKVDREIRAGTAAGEAADLAASCPAGEVACIGETLKKRFIALAKATAAARRSTRLRRHDKRNASCAAHVDRVPEDVQEETWAWDPFAPSLVWGDDGPPARNLSVPAEPARRVRHLFKPAAVPAALISVVDDFLSDEECDAVKAQATPRLARATHAHEGDLAHVSKARDSQQATVRPARGRSGERDFHDPIARLKARTVALANAMSNFSLGLAGQEDLMAVQYNKGQQYMLHCDGSCDGTPFAPGGRLATVLMYCETADGGGTAFPNANVHVVPQRGQAVYFHYRGWDPAGTMEDWHTEHSGCPLRNGSKWVITQWLRDGVSKERPHSRFDPSGGPIG